MGIMLKPTYLHGKNTVDELNMIKAKKKKKRYIVDVYLVEVEPNLSLLQLLVT